MYSLASNNLTAVTETGCVEAREVEGESKEVGDTVIYQGREMVVSRGVDGDGDLKMTNMPDISGITMLAAILSQTNITNLKCAAVLNPDNNSVCCLVSAP